MERKEAGNYWEKRRRFCGILRKFCGRISGAIIVLRIEGLETAMKVKKFGVCLLMIFVFSAIGTAVALAMEQVSLPFSDHGVTVSIQADVPDGFEEDMEIYLNGSPYYLSAVSGYHMETELEPGKYEIKVLSYSDFIGRYSFFAPEALDTEINRDITIKVTDTWEDREEGEAHEFGEEEQDGWEEFEPELLDFSDGEPYGTILIDSEPYGAVRNASFCLVGEGKVYEIPLKNDYAGCARVRLPVGMYYESGTIHVELAENAMAPDGISYLWQHRDNPGGWGSYYQVEEGKTVKISDLMIMMVVDGDIAELNSNAFFSRKMVENREYLMESHHQKELESAFPESYGESQERTIASAEPVKEVPVVDWKEILTIVIGITAMIAAGGLAIWHRQRKP